MSDFSFNPFGTRAIVANFDCDRCGKHVQSGEIDVPSPNYDAETSHASQTDNDGYAVCDHCGKVFKVNIYVSYTGALGQVDDLSDSHIVTIVEVDDPYYEDQYEAISANTEFLLTLNNELDNLLALLSIDLGDEHLNKILCRQLYASAISAMETYLSDAFINTVLRNKQNMRRFFDTYKGFGDQSIAINNLYSFMDRVADVAKKSMLDVIYHNLPRVSQMYEDTLGVKFPVFVDIYKAVLIRHDLVHRSGKTKDGKEVNVDAQSVASIVKALRTFILDIDKQIEP